MIKIEHVVLASPEQMKFIVEGIRNPMNSWAKSDSQVCNYMSKGYCDACEKQDNCATCREETDFYLGGMDEDLMQRLANAGTDDRKFMRMMPVYARITAPLYWWKEFDTYKVGTVANSCSTMHKIQEKEFTLKDFSTEHLFYPYSLYFNDDIIALNECREKYLETKDKRYWWQMIQLLPSSYNQTRNVMMNYEVLANIYKSRKNHKLDEWKVHKTPEEHKFRNKDFASGEWGFCDWIETLPYSDLITQSSAKTDANTEIIDAMNTVHKEG